MITGLIGYSGFIGTTLRQQYHFSDLYRSTNIHTIRNKHFETIVCAGAPAQKWLANREPENDQSNILRLIEHLKTLQCQTFILISTVDVFNHPIGVNEASIIDESNLHPYGMNRRLLEKFVEKHFSNYLIVRLPGLIGPGLRKNILFDFLNHNDLHKIDHRWRFQFYPVVNLWQDIQIALNNNIEIIHLTAEPITVFEASQCFTQLDHHLIQLQQPVITYDMQSLYAPLFHATSLYQYSKKESLQAIRTYAQSEPLNQEKAYS